MTKRQRELLQAYANDVEGVPPSKNSKTETLSAENGEVYFNRDLPSLGGWLAQGWEMLRKRLGH